MKKKSADRGVRVNAVVLAVALGAMGLFVGVWRLSRVTL